MAEILEFEKKGFIVQFHTAISKLNNDLHNLETNKFAKEYMQICSFEDYANPFPISKFTLSKKQILEIFNTPLFSIHLTRPNCPIIETG